MSSDDVGVFFGEEMTAIVDALRRRSRYRYVQPVVVRAGRGWRVVSPCCSRNVDPDGGVIDIAWLEPFSGGWRLYAHDHAESRWLLQDEAPQLSDVLDVLCVDTARVFWP